MKRSGLNRKDTNTEYVMIRDDQGRTTGKSRRAKV